MRSRPPRARRGPCSRRSTPTASCRHRSHTTTPDRGEWRDPDSNRGHRDFQVCYHPHLLAFLQGETPQIPPNDGGVVTTVVTIWIETVDNSSAQAARIDDRLDDGQQRLGDPQAPSAGRQIAAREGNEGERLRGEDTDPE